MTTNIPIIKSKILEYLKERGPSLPVNLTKISGMNLTFTSAILSELLAERKIKISNLRVGSSPLYYLEGQEEKLENFIDNVKPIEKDAFIKLKQNRILEDEKQSPQIRVALRALKDFAVPIRVGEKLFWKYHLLSDEKAKEAIGEEKKEEIAVGQERVIGQSIWNDIKKEFSREEVEDIIRKRINEIVERIKEEGALKEEKKEKEEKEILQQEKTQEAKKLKKPKIEKTQNLFFDSVKKILEERGFLAIEILKQSKEKIFLTCSLEGKNFLLMAYNKKMIDEKEVFKDYKKYFKEHSGFFVVFKGEKKEKFKERKIFFDYFKDVFSVQ